VRLEAAGGSPAAAQEAVALEEEDVAAPEDVAAREPMVPPEPVAPQEDLKLPDSENSGTPPPQDPGNGGADQGASENNTAG